MGHRTKLIGACLAQLVMASLLCVGAGAQEVSFHRQVIPLLTRSGCNAGACHGAAAGRGGLHLSLFGGDPSLDYQSLVHQFEGRRIHRLEPAKSLLLRKPTGALTHGGDQLFDTDSPQYQILTSWIRQGARLDEAPHLKHFEVQAVPSPDAPETRYRLATMARFDSDSSLDVTALTQFTVNDPEALEFDGDQNTVRITRPGQHLLIARFLNQVKAIRLSLPFPADSAKPTSVADGNANNSIDREINTTLLRLNLPVGAQISDSEYLRRVTLDLAGRLPELEEVVDFNASQSVDKRHRVVDRLLASPAFTDYWTLIYARWLYLHSLPGEAPVVDVYGDWIRQSIIDGTAWPEMTRALLTAQGDSHAVGPANFSRMIGDARAHAEMVSQVFLGARLACANCHDHPLDRWTQDDYHGLAAMLSRIDRGRVVRFTTRGDVTHPKTAQPARWRLPGERFVGNDAQPTELLAEWLTKPPQVRLSQVFTNRVWSEMFGRGLVEAVDDHRETNPATHPELLDSLSHQVAAHNYDLRLLLRWIVFSQAYSREARDHRDPYYGYRQTRPLSAHVLADAIADVTGIPTAWPQLPLGTRAVRLLDPHSPAPQLDVLGRCRRANDCGSSPSSTGLATQLHLINGDLINRALADPNSRLARLSESHTPAQIVEEFCLRAFAEPPDDAQQTAWLVLLEPAPNLKMTSEVKQEYKERLQDWLWSVLSSQRFRNR